MVPKHLLINVSVAVTLCLTQPASVIYASEGNDPCPAANLTNHLDIIPEPVSVILNQGSFTLDRATLVIAGDAGALDAAGYICEKTGLAPGGQSETNGAIVFSAGDGIPREGYKLIVDGGGITILAAGHAGWFNGAVTLLQMMEPEVYRDGVLSPVDIPYCVIEDSPAFGYRGVHLDVVRGFVPFEMVLSYIDRMAMHKLNRFHWHLTDDEGWRVELDCYTELAVVGGYRGGDSPIKNIWGAWCKKYGGYYTKEQIREVVRYAATRNIEVIPEIDLPGHSRAVARIMPGILCRGDYDSIPFGYDARNVWCFSKEDNYQVLENILAEICELFPSGMIHIGGDEVDPTQWEACPDCSQVLKEITVNQMQGRFMNRLTTILKKYGKRPAVWNEAIEGGNLEPGAVIYAWENVEKGKLSVSKGFNTVLMPSQFFYFDMKQSRGEPGLSWAAIFDYTKVLSFDPGNYSGKGEVIGVEGALWTEALSSNGLWYVDYQTYPRICALAQVAWGGRPVDPGRFTGKLDRTHYRRLGAMDIGFRLPPPVVKLVGSELRLSGMKEGSTVEYSTDKDPGQWTAIEGTTLTEDSDIGYYRIRYRYLSGVSGITEHKNSKLKSVKPVYRITSSVPANKERPYTRASDHDPRTFAATSRTVRQGDFFIYSFTNPQNPYSVKVTTGNLGGIKNTVPCATIEISMDGEDWEQIADNFSSNALIHPGKPFKFIRITSKSDLNGDASVYLYDLEIMTF